MTKTPDLAILIPVLARPHRVGPILDSIASTTKAYRVLFIADSDDEEELAEIEKTGEECLRLNPPVTWTQKINAGYRATTEPFLFLAADDLNFHEGWYERAREKMTDGIGVVGTCDLANRRTMRGQHSTHMLVRRSYIEEFSGVIDHPGMVVCENYTSDYGDDELVQTAMARNAYAHAFDSIVEHLHPIVGNRPGKLPDDDTYRLGRANFRRNRSMFRHRQHLWTT